jgi:hypothetical protein
VRARVLLAVELLCLAAVTVGVSALAGWPVGAIVAGVAGIAAAEVRA